MPSGRNSPECATIPRWPGALTTWRRGSRPSSNSRISSNPYINHSRFSAPLHPVIANESIQSISFFRWGLVPFWTKDKAAAERIRTQTLNAKAETIHQKPSFRASIMTKRCLVLVDGFYEWREEIPLLHLLEQQRRFRSGWNMEQMAEQPHR